MDHTLRERIARIHSKDRDVQGEAYQLILGETNAPVDWAYEVWDELVESLSDPDNRTRSIASQLLCNLAKSDPEVRIRKDFPALLAVTKDEKFVTARHCLLALWKIGVAGPEQRAILIEGLEGRFRECSAEKNGTLIRHDIIQGLKKLHDEVGDEAIRDKALDLIESETDLKYRKKYASLWKTKRASKGADEAPIAS